MLSNKCPYSIASAGHVAFVGGGISVRITHPKPAGIPRVTRHKKAGGKSKGLGIVACHLPARCVQFHGV